MSGGHRRESRAYDEDQTGTSSLDTRVLTALQLLVLGLPIFLGGRQTAALAVAALVTLALLGLTLRERSRRGGVHAPGVAALAAFVALGLGTTIPLPPDLIERVAPATFRLYATALPGWPGGGGWSVWRPLAIHPFGVWIELLRFSVGLGVFAVLVGYPWGEARTRVFGRLLLTLVAGGALLSGLALVEQVAGNGNVLWVTDIPSIEGRAAGPFVNPNHFAAWLEMIIPTGIAYAIALFRRVRQRLVSSATASRGIGVSGRRAWVAALVVHQQSLWWPLVAGSAVLVMTVAHVATGSRGGTAALLVGLAVASAGILARRVQGARLRRAAPLVLAGVLVVASLASVVGWGSLEEQQATGTVESVDVSLGSRLAVSAKGLRLIGDFPLFGTGLGSWLHAFRSYVEPPIEGGIWDHAHDDYVELTAETGLFGAALALLFGFAVFRAARRREQEEEPSRSEAPAAFRRPDWAVALGEATYLRWGLAGGVAAMLVHSAVDFGLRIPGNLLLLMVVLGLLVLSGRAQPARRAPALALLAGLFVLPFLAQGANTVVRLAGATPLSPHDCLEAAEVTVAEEGDEGRARAVALVHHAIDWAPVDSEAHRAYAEAVGDTPEGEAALRRAVSLDPWSATLRDDLAIRLLDEGDREAGAAELEESMRRFPYLASHGYLSPELDPAQQDAKRLIRALAEGDTMTIRLASLDADMAEAIDRGLVQAQTDAAEGDERAAVVNDRVTLLEARERWGEAAVLLEAEAGNSPSAGTALARAAHNYLKAREYAAAEQSLLAAVVRMPDAGDLYRDLAVDVYAARGDYEMAENVLDAGQRNAIDMLPVYDGVTEVLQLRESARSDDLVGPAAPRQLEAELIP